jgi:hypothetical protein
MMLIDSNLTGSVLLANAGGLADESAAVLLVWMDELEASLLGSRKALLALDLAGIERGTSEQVGLVRNFGAMQRQSGKDNALGRPAGTPELVEELRRRGRRIQEAARLQAALLAREGSKLRVLANMLADPSIDYGRLLEHQLGAPGGRGRACETVSRIWK